MSTITRELAKLFRKITNSEIDAEGNAHVVLSPADSLLINNARIALASLEAEPAGWQVKKHGGNWVSIKKEDVDHYRFNEELPVREVYTATPSPVVPDAIPKLKDGQRFKYVKYGIRYSENYANGWNACRSAMLQGAELVTTDYKLPFEQWLSQQTGTIDVDCGCVTTEAFYHWLRVAYEDGSSPVTPDAWIPVSERMPDKLIPVMVMYEGGEMWSAMWNGNRWDDGTEYPDPHAVTHWREMPAAPQQEA